MSTPAASETSIALFAQALGEDAVVTGFSRLGEYGDPYGFAAPAGAPHAAVLPRTVEDVQSVLRIARQQSVPLWTVSRGRNLGYGGAQPCLPGSVIVDLSRMDRVIAVDEECAYAIVEPGVSFSALDEQLRLNASSLSISVPDLSWGSVIGNTLERGFGYAAHSNHSAAQCGMEVVLASGDVVRTGMGAMDGNPAWGLYKGGYGPSLDGLFFQSNLGIVTKMGVWLMPRGSHQAVGMITAACDEDLGTLIEVLRPLMLDGTIQSNLLVANAIAAASKGALRSRWYHGSGTMPPSAVEAMLDELPIGRWNARFGLYGPEEMVEARLGVVARAVRSRASLKLEVTRYSGDVDPATVAPPDRAQLGIPSTEAVQMAAWRGGEPGHVDVALVCPPTTADAARVTALLRAEVEAHGFDFAAALMTFPRHVIAVCLIAFDRGDPRDCEAVSDLVPSLITQARVAGYGVYRGHVAFQELIAHQYDFNNHALMRLNTTIKRALDPTGVLSPGKQGIWSEFEAHTESPRL